MADLSEQAGENEHVMEGAASDDLDWVDLAGAQAEIKKKTTLVLDITKTEIVADGIDQALVASIPVGAFVTWPDGVREEVVDGLVEFATSYAGTYTLLLDGVKYLPQEITIEATIPAA
jgi:hypothetical protein